MRRFFSLIPQSKIEEIVNAAPVDQVIGEYVRLKKRGVNLLGLCPFHNEKTPSFTVSPAKGIYKCFGCGKAGNVVSFVMEHDSLSYIQALKQLAEKFNIEWPEKQADAEEEKQRNTERESLQIINNWAAAYFEDILWNDEEGKNIGLSYFEERGFRHDIIKKFRLGYSKESWDHFTQRALQQQFNPELLVASGLVKAKQHDEDTTLQQDDRKYDAFRGRVMFPIHGTNGKVIAFAGRYLKKDPKSPKYVNSPETALYHKSNELYGLFFARNAIRQQDSVYLVEGYTDVISMHQAGVENVVASSGTSLTENQIRLIKRFTEQVTVLYDGDAAGIKASLRGIDMLLEQGLNVKVVLFPDGEDPDSYCRKAGNEAFASYLKEQAKDFILFKSHLLMQDSANDPLKKATAARDIVESITKIPDGIKRAAFLKECATLMKLNEQMLINEANKIRREYLSRKNKEWAADEPVISAQEQEVLNDALRDDLDIPQEDYQEKDIIRTLLNFGHMPVEGYNHAVHYILDQVEKDEIEFEHPVAKLVVDEFRHLHNSGMPVTPNHFIHHPNTLIAAYAASILSVQHEVSPVWEKRFDVVLDKPEDIFLHDINSALLHLRLRNVEKLIAQNQKEFEQANTEEDVLLHQRIHMHLLEKRTELTSQIGTVVVK